MPKPRIAVVGIPGKWSTEVLADALEQRTGFRLVVDMHELSMDLQQGRLQYRDQDLCQLDGIIVKKITAQYSPQSLDRLEMLRLAEAAGVRVFSPVDSMARLINRLSGTMALQAQQIPMPETCVTEYIDQAIDAIQRFGSAVLKPLYSTKARGMCIIDADQPCADIRSAVRAFMANNPVMYIQKRLSLPDRDLALVFLGGEYLGTYARISQSASWNTTINSGGRYEGFQAPPDMIEIARRAQAVFPMDFTTVDIAETEGGPVVFEVSAFGGFKGALEGAGINAAARYADYAVEQLS